MSSGPLPAHARRSVASKVQLMDESRKKRELRSDVVCFLVSREYIRSRLHNGVGGRRQPLQRQRSKPNLTRHSHNSREGTQQEIMVDSETVAGYDERFFAMLVQIRALYVVSFGGYRVLP